MSSLREEHRKKLYTFNPFASKRPVYFEYKPKPGFTLEPVKVVSGLKLTSHAATQLVNPSTWAFWDKVEMLEDRSPGMIREQFLMGCKYTLYPALTAAFGTDAPPSWNYLLHFGRNWKKNLKSGKLPVLLIPGAGDHAHRAYADPSYGIPGLNQSSGIAQYLDAAGFPVFAITFSHPQGCNFIQYEQISGAIKRIRKVCNVNKVDLVAHSKGNIPARMYVSNMAGVYSQDLVFGNVKKYITKMGIEELQYVNVVFPAKRWMSPFAYDVRRLVQLAAPNKGIDSTFRTFSSSAGAFVSKQAPIPFVRYFVKRDFAHDSIQESIYYEYNNPQENNYFPGQCQILYDLATEDVPLQNTLSSMDAVEKMYYGGHSLIGDSYGIEYAIAQGGNLIDYLRIRGTSEYVEVATAVGTKNVVNVTYAGLPIPIMYEGVTSDGLLFKISAEDTRGINVSMGVYEFPINHLEMTYDSKISEWVEDILSYE